MAIKGNKYITIHIYRGVVDKATGVPKGYKIRIKDYEEGSTERVPITYRK